MKIDHKQVNDGMALVYLATPYSHKDASVREDRFVQACKMAAYLMKEKGVAVFCPIAHSHPIEVKGLDKVYGWDFWLAQDFAILKRCDALYVYKMPGWQESTGVNAEIDYATANDIPVFYLEEKDFGMPYKMVYPTNGPAWIEKFDIEERKALGY